MSFKAKYAIRCYLVNYIIAIFNSRIIIIIIYLACHLLLMELFSMSQIIKTIIKRVSLSNLKVFKYYKIYFY